MSILVTGASGFSGLHLTNLLSRKTTEKIVAGYYKTKPQFAARHVHPEKLNLLDSMLVEKVCKKYRPREVYHLAALVKEKNKPANLAHLLQNNVLGTTHLFESIRNVAPEARVLNVGSSYEYGKVSEKAVPIKEVCSLHPHTPYAVSKVCQEMVARYYQMVHGLRVICTRTFHYAGPGQPFGFFFSNRIAELRAGEGKQGMVVDATNPGDRFDYTDVRDVVHAYYLLMKKGETGEVYNVCSGKAFSVKEALMLMKVNTGVSFRLRTVKQKPDPFNVSLHLGDNRKLKRHTDWEPKIELAKTIRDMYA